MTKQQHELLSKILIYILASEEQSYEESECNKEHIYALARTAWCDFEIDIVPNK